MNRRVLYVILGVAIVASVAGAIVWQTQAQQPPGEEVHSVVVERGNIVVTVSASGSVKPRSRVHLAFESAGLVAEVAVENESRVKAGDILARLDTGKLTLAVEEALVELESAEAQLAQIEAGPQTEEITTAEANLQAAQARVSAAAAYLAELESGADDAQIAAAEADVAKATVEQIEAKDRHDKTMQSETLYIYRKKITFYPSLGPIEETARFRLTAADEALVAAQAQLDELLAGADPDQVRAAQANLWTALAQRDAAQARLDLLLAGATDMQIAIAKARVAQARVALEHAKLSLEEATLRAPFDGVVAAVDIKVGERASAGQSVITLLDTSSFYVIVNMDEIDVGHLSEGYIAQVTFDALPGTVVTGTVEHIAPAASAKGGVVYYKVAIALSPTDAPIRADMTANTIIVVEELDEVLVIPTWMVRVDSATGQTYVHRQVGDGVERVEVALGIIQEETAQVLGGLSERDVVVLVADSADHGFLRRP